MMSLISFTILKYQRFVTFCYLFEIIGIFTVLSACVRTDSAITEFVTILSKTKAVFVLISVVIISNDVIILVR